jgi:hypothetical protein
VKSCGTVNIMMNSGGFVSRQIYRESPRSLHDYPRCMIRDAIPRRRTNLPESSDRNTKFSSYQLYDAYTGKSYIPRIQARKITDPFPPGSTTTPLYPRFELRLLGSELAQSSWILNGVALQQCLAYFSLMSGNTYHAGHTTFFDS